MLGNWHKNMIAKIQEKTGISDYQLLWLAFAEGLLLGLLIGWWFL